MNQTGVNSKIRVAINSIKSWRSINIFISNCRHLKYTTWFLPVYVCCITCAGTTVHHTLVSLDGHVHVRVNVCAVRLHHNRQIHATGSDHGTTGLNPPPLCFLMKYFRTTWCIYHFFNLFQRGWKNRVLINIVANIK